jgi:hypothetical protein
MSDDTPTQRFDAQPAATGPGEPKRKSRLALILGIVGGVLLLAVILLVVLLVRGQGTPLAAGTNSPIANTTPSAAPSVTTPPVTPTASASASAKSAPPPPPPPQSTDPAFTTFVVQSAINSCSSGPYYTGAPPIIKVTWATVRTNSVWIIQGTDDAADAQYMQLPVSGNQSNFPYELDFACGSPSATYTMTIVGSNGKHVSKHWTIKNTSPGQ